MIPKELKEDINQVIPDLLGEEAVKFANWLSRNAYDPVSAELNYSWTLNDGEWLYSQDGMAKFTTEELYEIFKKQQNK